MTIAIRPLSRETLDDYLDYFDNRAFSNNPHWAGCYCLFPYHDAHDGDWTARSGDENRAAMTDLINRGDAQGYLAYDGDQVVGYCNAAPRDLYPNLKRLPFPGDGVGAISCFVIAPDRRRQGLARRLLQAACDGLKDQGCHLVIAKPVRGIMAEDKNFVGPLDLYLSEGFTETGASPQGDVFVQKQL